MQLCLKGILSIRYSNYIKLMKLLIFQGPGADIHFWGAQSTTMSAVTYMNCDSCSKVTYPKASNDCHLAGSCQSNGHCFDEIVRANGSPCSSQLFGKCYQGLCTTVMPSMSTSMLPILMPSSTPSLGPTAYPSAIPSTVSNSIPSLRPTVTPYTVPSSTSSQGPSVNPSTALISIPSQGPTATPSTILSTVPTSSSNPFQGQTVTPSRKYSTVGSTSLHTMRLDNTLIPTAVLSRSPSYYRTVSPSAAVSTSRRPTAAKPSKRPSTIPAATTVPTRKPTKTFSPFISPRKRPTHSPSSNKSSFSDTFMIVLYIHARWC